MALGWTEWFQTSRHCRAKFYQFNLVPRDWTGRKEPFRNEFAINWVNSLFQAFYVSSLSLLRTALHYLNAWNRLLSKQTLTVPARSQGFPNFKFISQHSQQNQRLRRLRCCVICFKEEQIRPWSRGGKMSFCERNFQKRALAPLPNMRS